MKNIKDDDADETILKEEGKPGRKKRNQGIKSNTRRLRKEKHESQ